MFNIDELKEIRKKYFYDPDTRKIKLQFRARGDSSVKKPEELNQDERNKIISALYEYKIVKDVAKGNGIAGERTEEDVLTEIQTEVYNEILTPGKKSAQPFVLMAGRPRDIIMMDITQPTEEKRHMADIYFNYILSENRKKATNIQRGIEDGMVYTISYDIENLEKENGFRKQLDPNNPQYTQPQKKLDLTPEQLAHRKAIVERLITDYRKMEHDEWYESRTQKEETDMQRIANTVNQNSVINTSIKGPGLFRLLIAAQNLSLDGEQDFLEEMLKQPAVSDALLELKKSGQVHTIYTEAQENEKNGKVNAEGIVNGHSITYGERLHKQANEYISEKPNAVAFAKKELSVRSSFPLEYSNSELTKKSRVIELVARTQGKLTNRTRNGEGNIVLQVNDGKEQSK